VNQSTRAAAAGRKKGQSDQIKTIEFERKRGMDSYLEKLIGQDQQDGQDNAACGRKLPRRRQKKS
jgi:hypothetical protein